MTKLELDSELERCRKLRRSLLNRPYDVTKEIETLRERFIKAYNLRYPKNNIFQ